MKQLKEETMTPSEALTILEEFISPQQVQAIAQACNGDEGEHFRQILQHYGERVLTMPKTYEQDGLGECAVAYLHYFTGSCDWYITERDSDPDGEGQHQAFGIANLGYGPELGYISIPELIANGAEFDLHFEPAPLADIEKAHDAKCDACGYTESHDPNCPRDIS